MPNEFSSVLSFLELAWAKRDFGLALEHRDSVSILNSWRLWWLLGVGDEVRGADILGDLLAAQCRELCCARAHDGIGGRDVLLDSVHTRRC